METHGHPGSGEGSPRHRHAGKHSRHKGCAAVSRPVKGGGESHLHEKALHGRDDAITGHRHSFHGGDDHHAMMIDDFKKRFFVSIIFTIPILVLSPMTGHFFGYEIAFPGSSYILFALSSFVYFWGGKPFLQGFFDEMKERNPGMMTLIAMATTVAYLYSSATVFGLEGADFFWELATLIDIMLLGHWLEMKAVMRASGALHLLVELLPSYAHRVNGGEVEEARIEDLAKGDTILVKPGEKIPADGVVTDGMSYLDESMLTGESRPVKKEKGDKAIAGSVNGNGSLRIRVERAGKDSYLNKVIDLVETAQKSKSRMQNLSDRAAKGLTYAALTIGFGTLIVWLGLGYEFVFALERMVAVMVIACPHALGLAIPLTVAISTAVSAQNGLLIRRRTAFEEARKITAIIFDKTGTLTSGAFGVTRYRSLSGSLSDEDILTLAGALEQNSEHPIAVGIMKKIEERGLDIPEVESFRALTGRGVEGIVNGKDVRVVSPGYLRENRISMPRETGSDASETLAFVIVDNQLQGYVALADAIRPESKEAIATLKKSGVKIFMATGDHRRVAKAVADALGVDGYFAEVLPHEKVEIVKDLQKKGEYVAMTGDGINDAPALAQANVGIAVGSGADVAAETADIVLANSNPKDIVNMASFGKATYRKMIQNLVWATVYNVAAIPLAAGALYSTGFVLSPAAGTVFMSLSTIIVAANAQLLKKRLQR